MAPTTSAQPLRSALPRRICLSNAAFGSIFGVVLLVEASPVATFLGLNAPVIFIVMGILLLVAAFALVWTVVRQRITRRMLLSMGLIDSAWVVGSIVLLLLPTSPFTVGGKWVIALLALVVADFACFELYDARKAH